MPCTIAKCNANCRNVNGKMQNALKLSLESEMQGQTVINKEQNAKCNAKRNQTSNAQNAKCRTSIANCRNVQFKPPKPFKH